MDGALPPPGMWRNTAHARSCQQEFWKSDLNNNIKKNEFQAIFTSTIPTLKIAWLQLFSSDCCQTFFLQDKWTNEHVKPKKARSKKLLPRSLENNCNQAISSSKKVEPNIAWNVQKWAHNPSPIPRWAGYHSLGPFQDSSELTKLVCQYLWWFFEINYFKKYQNIGGNAARFYAIEFRV